MSQREHAEDVLAHYGVKGMKWGVRKDRSSGGPEVVLSRSLRDGGKLTVTKDPPGLIQKIFPKVGANWSHFTLSDGAGSKVGEASFRKVGEDELNLVWVEVKSKHRGKGYASAAVKGAVNYAKDKGISKLTLEVPGISPDARHIYEKQGFVDKGLYKGSTTSDLWGGLTRMELQVDTSKVKHSSVGYEEFIDYVIDALNDSSDVEHADTENALAHYGVKGMKWGVRKDRATSRQNGSKPELTPAQRRMRRKLRTSLALTASAVVLDRGAKWALSNPDKLEVLLARASNLKNGTKAIGPGYSVVKLALDSSGVYR